MGWERIQEDQTSKVLSLNLQKLERLLLSSSHPKAERMQEILDFLECLVIVRAKLHRPAGFLFLGMITETMVQQIMETPFHSILGGALTKEVNREDLPVLSF